MDWAKLRQGVTIAWLAGAFRMDPKTVKKRLAPLAPKSKGSNRPLYDLEMAASYLVKPRFDVGEYIRNMNPMELPPVLRKEFWDAENKRLNYEERAGELWATERVMAVFAEAFVQLKNQMQLWPDEVEREVGLTKEQHKALAARVDALRVALHSIFVEMPKLAHNGSVLEERALDDEAT